VQNGESQCARQGGIWEPDGEIDCFLGLCDFPAGSHGEFEVTFSVTNVETLGSLQFDVDYGAVPGSFDGAGSTVACTRLAGDFAAFNDIESTTTLSIAIISTVGFIGPIDIVRCTFCCPPPHDPSDYVITIQDQSRPDFTPASATVAVTSLRSTATTTTTVPATDAR
jgi:hypothetical protein